MTPSAQIAREILHKVAEFYFDTSGDFPLKEHIEGLDEACGLTKALDRAKAEALEAMGKELESEMSNERVDAASKAYYDGYLSGVKVMENVRTRWMIDDFRNGYWCALNKLSQFRKGGGKKDE